MESLMVNRLIIKILLESQQGLQGWLLRKTAFKWEMENLKSSVLMLKTILVSEDYLLKKQDQEIA